MNNMQLYNKLLKLHNEMVQAANTMAFISVIKLILLVIILWKVW